MSFTKFVARVAMCSVAALAFAAGPANAQENDDFPAFVNVVAATSGGVFFFIGNGLAQILNQEIDGIRATAQSTAGTPRILETLNAGDGEIGFGQSSIAHDALNGIGQFDGTPMDNLRGMTFLYPNVFQFIVRRGAGIETPYDLKGRRVGVGEVGGGAEITSREFFAAIPEIDFPGDIAAEYTTGAQSSDLLRNNQLDGANMVAALGYAQVTDLMSTGDYELLDIPEEIVERVRTEVNTAFFPFEIPANTYPNQPEPVQTYAEANWLFARADLSDAFVYRVLEVIYSDTDRLVGLHAVLQSTTLENSQSGALIPLHPGAERFFTDHGIDIQQ